MKQNGKHSLKLSHSSNVCVKHLHRSHFPSTLAGKQTLVKHNSVLASVSLYSTFRTFSGSTLPLILKLVQIVWYLYIFKNTRSSLAWRAAKTLPKKFEKWSIQHYLINIPATEAKISTWCVWCDSKCSIVRTTLFRPALWKAVIGRKSWRFIHKVERDRGSRKTPAVCCSL